MIVTYRYRVKGTATAKALARMARAVNFVWNYCGETQERARYWGRRWPTAFDLSILTTGCSKELALHSDTINATCRQFAASRDRAKRRPRWRGRKSLGWVPFNTARAIRMDDDSAVFLGRRYRLWYSRPLAGTIRCGSFAADARGRWYLNLQVEIEPTQTCGSGEVGVDLGISTLATLSTGEKVKNPRHIRRHGEALAKAQRAGRKKRARAIHAKLSNCRKHHLHEVTTRLIRENRLVVVGDVSPAQLAQTKFAKSVMDAGWSSLRGMLRYKAMRHGARYVETDERWTTRTCSACGARGGPEGIAGLGVRDWTCLECGVVHDRDVNSAVLILCSGRSAGLQQTEIPIFQGRGRC